MTENKTVFCFSRRTLEIKKKRRNSRETVYLFQTWRRCRAVWRNIDSASCWNVSLFYFAYCGRLK